MKNFKMILKSLISNNTCIDGGRGKKWYYAITMFFLSIVVALVPTFVRQLKTHGDDTFANAGYGGQEAFMAFSEELNQTTEYSLKIIPDTEAEKPTNKLVVEGEFNKFEYKDKNGEKVLFTFIYCNEITGNVSETLGLDGKTSYAIFTEHEFFIYIANPNSETGIANLPCQNAYKYFDIPEKGYIDLKEYLVKDDTLTVTQNIEATWSNWKEFCKTAYNYNRLDQLWKQCLLIGGINIVITLLMGFMIWILTRGKKNPYRCFTLWETQKIAYWCSITPAILTIALGFLLKNFANVLFPLLLGVRVMWLSMKSLRPDGTGYAAN